MTENPSSYPTMTTEDWTLLSDHLLDIVKDINAVIGFESDEYPTLKYRAIKRVVKGLKEIALHYPSSPTTVKEEMKKNEQKREDD